MTDKEVKHIADTISKFTLTMEESVRCIKILSKKPLPSLMTPKQYGKSLHKQLRTN